jgi:hypothetical protein
MELRDGQIPLPDGRTLGYADYGSAAQTAVLWCHGGPLSRLEPQVLATAARDSGLRIVGIDRPGSRRALHRP